VKIPGTLAGLPAITRALAQGINVNVTLLFSVERYGQVIRAFLAGLEGFYASDRARSEPAPFSVASFFVSRLDGKVDPLLERAGAAGHMFASQLRGTIAVANAVTAYERFQQSVGTVEWQALAARGAHVQRPLWASTSTKDPWLPDTYYVEALLAPHTVNTLPPETFAAFRDHGNLRLRIDEERAHAGPRLAALREFGIDLEAITRDLEEDGVAKFQASYRSLLSGIEAKSRALVAR
jgi:transaldolase